MKTHHKITYRNVLESDRSFLLALYASTREDVRNFATHMSKNQQDDFINMQFELQDHHYKKYYPEAKFLVIQNYKKKIGRLYVDEANAEVCIIDITIDPNYRSKGIGLKIMSSIISDAEEKNKTVSIHVAKNNKAINLYNRLGFEIVEDTSVYHRMVKYPENQLQLR